MTTEERFWQKVNIRENGDCWEWQAGMQKDNYGAFTFRNKIWRAHRVAYTLTYGEIPITAGHVNTCVLHTCDNPRCCNPNHLFIGSNADNIADKVNKNRCNPLKGKECNLSKLLENQVLEIRSKHQTGAYTYRDLASIYNVSRSNIEHIIRRFSWKHI